MRIYFVLISLMVTFTAQAADSVNKDIIERAAAFRDAAMQNDSAYVLLESLTTEIGPRLAGTEAEKRAAHWAVAKLEAMGADRVWLEEFPLTVWRRTEEKLTVLGAQQTLHMTALGGSVSAPSGGIEADVVLFPDTEALKHAERSEVEGKIVFINNRMQRALDGSGYRPAVVARRDGASIAASLGAQAVLIRSIGTDSHRFPHTGQLLYASDQPKIPAAALSNPDADQLARLLARGDVRVDMKLTTSTEPGTSYNVVAEVTGSSKSDEVIVMGSHIDSWDLGTGAVDDGAGVALNMATLGLFADRKATERPLRTVRIVLFGAEEQGLTGAKAYAAAHSDEAGKIMLAAESDFGAGPVWALASKNVGPESVSAIDAMAQLMGPLDIVRSAVKAYGGPDVGELGKLGVPVMDLKQNGTDYFDLHHTADDTFDKVDAAHMRQNLAAWAVFAHIAAHWEGDFRK